MMDRDDDPGSASRAPVRSASWAAGVDFAAVARELPDVIVVFDAEKLRVRDVNRGDEGAFGYGRAELLELDAFALFPRWWDAEKTLEPGAAVATYVKLAGGEELPVDMRLSRARLGGADSILACVRTGRPPSDVERELAEANTYLHAIVENIPDMIFVKDAETLAFRRFNRAGEELLGFLRGELLGKTDHDFYPKEQADFFHEKDRETLAKGEIVDIPEEPIETKDKGRRILHTRKIPIYDDRGVPLYLLGISEDITSRIKAEQALREFADVVRYLRDAVVTFRPDGEIVSWNPGAERLYGVAAEDAVGASFVRFVPEAELAIFKEQLSAVAAGRVVEVAERTRVLADGRELEVEEALFAVFDDKQNLQRIASVARDLSEVARWRRATQVLAGRAEPAPLSQPRAPGSPAMAEAVATAARVAADRDATVLLLGETGVGKSWLARRIHGQSARADKPFFEINCAGLAPQLLESELFGHERGAFTGATGTKRGLVETAEGGTLFLDEVGELSLAVQAQLLTFLDGKSFRRVGGNRVLTADVRLIAATNVDLRAAVEAGRFRRDLYYRLSVVPIEIPALRERGEDIRELAKTVLDELKKRAGRPNVTLSNDALSAIEAYEWPGNIRELRNALERALILGIDAEIKKEDLPTEIRATRKALQEGILAAARPLEEMERDQILRALRETGGNRTKAAALLGISRSTMKRRLAEMRRLGIDVPAES